VRNLVGSQQKEWDWGFLAQGDLLAIEAIACARAFGVRLGGSFLLGLAFCWNFFKSCIVLFRLRFGGIWLLIQRKISKKVPMSMEFSTPERECAHSLRSGANLRPCI
jgi:hypothetical protein